MCGIAGILNLDGKPADPELPNGWLPGTTKSGANSNDGGAICTGVFNATPPTFACSNFTLPTLFNVKGGNYRIWSTLRAVVDTTVQNYQQTTLTGSITPAGLIQAAQDQAAGTIPDFVPWQICLGSSCASKTLFVTSFRSHYGSNGVFPQNGILAPFDAAKVINASEKSERVHFYPAVNAPTLPGDPASSPVPAAPPESKPAASEPQSAGARP